MERILKNSLLFFFISIAYSTFVFGQEKPVNYEAIHTLSGHKSQVQNIRFSHDGKILASAGHDKTVILWDVKTGKELRKLSGHTGGISEVTFNHNSTLVASASSDGTVRVWRVHNGALYGVYQNIPQANIKNPQKSVSFVTFSPDDKYIYFAGDGGSVMRADVGIPNQTAEILTSISVQNKFQRMTGGTISPDNTSLVLTTGNYWVVLDLGTGKFLRSHYYKYASLNDIVSEPYVNKKYVSVWSYDGYVTVWDYTTGAIYSRIQVTYMNRYSAATFSLDGKYLATGVHDNIAKVWDWKKPRLVATLHGHQKMVRTIRFSPVEHLIATASYDGTVKLWKIKPPEEEEEEENTEPEKLVERDTVYLRDTVYVEKKQDKPNPIEGLTEEIETSIDESDLVVGNTINLKNIQFERGKAVLLEQSHAELQKLLELMQEHKKMLIRLDGHTDNVGRSHLNLRLSGERIRIVKEYLINKGVKSYRIRTRAFGDSKPIASNKKEKTRKLNRRVEVTILEL
jgi:WD40 repeat protein